MNIEQEIRAQIEKNKGLKLAVGEINNHLSILEGLLRNERADAQKQVDEAYKRGLEDGKAGNDKGCEGCLLQGTGSNICDQCCNSYANQWMARDDKIEVGDEVKHGDSTGIVYEVGDLILSGLCTGDESFVPFQWYKEECKKTGRHADIQSILEELRND